MKNGTHFHHSLESTSLPRFDSLLEAMPEALVVLNGASHVVFANTRAEQLFGYERDELLNRPVAMLLAERLRESQSSLLAEYVAAAEEGPLDGSLELCGQKKDGGEFPLGVRIGHLKTNDGAFVLSVFQDIAALRQQEERLAEQSRQLREANAQLEEFAHRDSLTGLQNQAAFRQKLEEEFRRAVRHQTALSVLMIDLDHFKAYNENFGHAAGDEVLRTASRVLEDAARTTDSVARFEGEEFAILLPLTGRDGAMVLAERFRDAIEGVAWQERSVTISVGVATHESELEAPVASAHQYMDSAALLDGAERALEQAKERGRNRVIHAADLDLPPATDDELSVVDLSVQNPGMEISPRETLPRETLPIEQPLLAQPLLAQPLRAQPVPTAAPISGPTTGSRAAGVLAASQPQVRSRRLARRPRSPLEYGLNWLARAIREENILLFLLGVRWISLLPPALALFPFHARDLTKPFVFLAALLTTITLSTFHLSLNRLLLQKPTWLLLDMSLCAVFIALTGGTASPYERYAALPLLAAAYFFRIRGGLIAVAAYIPLYLAALAGAHYWSGATAGVQEVANQFIIFFLIALVFGYPSVLLQRLRMATAQLHRAQREAARAETLAATGRMAAQVSHEIRNPLTTIGGFARSLLRRPDDAERVRKNAQIIADEVGRLEELLTDMLNFSRSPELKLQPENLHEILDKAWLLSGDALSEKSRVAVRKNYDTSLPPVEADASALLRAFLNVMRNAVQIMPEGGTVTITTRRVEDEVEIAIADTGPGIAPDVLPTIFAPFITHRPNGTGLGLAVTQKVMQQHGGHVEAQSEPGQGANFVFHLPLKPAVVPKPA